MHRFFRACCSFPCVCARDQRDNNEREKIEREEIEREKIERQEIEREKTERELTLAVAAGEEMWRIENGVPSRNSVSPPQSPPQPNPSPEASLPPSSPPTQQQLKQWQQHQHVNGNGVDHGSQDEEKAFSALSPVAEEVRVTRLRRQMAMITELCLVCVCVRVCLVYFLTCA